MPAEETVRVAMVVTRSLDVDAVISRVRIMRQIRDAFSAQFSVQVYRLRPLPEIALAGSWARMAGRLVSGIVRGRPVPLQCALYSDKAAIDQLTYELAAGGYDSIYLDSVRSLALLRSLRARLPHVRIAVDFDDLMSRRMELLAAHDWPIQLGHVQKWFSPFILRKAQGTWSRSIARYEARTLTRAELEACRLADAVVLVSPVEAELLRQRVPSGSCDIYGVIPAQAAETKPISVTQPVRFVFIGSDGDGQNRQSIDYLLGLWRRERPNSKLHFYGRQHRVYEPVQNVVWNGFVENIAQVYTEDSILILPVFRAGGIKTKLLEAWGQGRPALINPLATEGLPLRGYPLAIKECEWHKFLANPAAFHATCIQAAEIGCRFVAQNLSHDSYAEKWVRIVRGGSYTNECNLAREEL